MFARIAPRLLDNGWHAIIPLIGKKAFTKAWSRYNTQPLEDDQLEAWCREFPHHNIGYPVPPTIVVVDSDILNPVLAERVGQIRERDLGPTPLVRIGLAPKTAAFYRGTSIGSCKAHPIEIFNGSGQVVIYGTHPDTGRPYFYPDEEPLHLSPDDLPIITSRQVNQFLQNIAGLLPDAPADRSRRSGGSGGGVVDLDLFRRLRQERSGKRRRAWRLALAHQLKSAEPGTYHNTLLSVILALVNCGFTDRRIHSFIRRHFAAPRTGKYAAVWQQIDPAIKGARKRRQSKDEAFEARVLQGLG